MRTLACYLKKHTKVEAKLNFSDRFDRLHFLTRWTSLNSHRDTSKPLENLTNCENAICAFEQGVTACQPNHGWEVTIVSED